MDGHAMQGQRIGSRFWIPEQFLWYVFECLCIAGLVLEHGEMEKNPMNNWTPIVHRDMKVSNIFLGLPNEERYCRYPVPKLGDFGLALYLPGGEVMDHDLQGTKGNMPVEQNAWFMLEHDVAWPLSSKANVWYDTEG